MSGHILKGLRVRRTQMWTPIQNTINIPWNLDETAGLDFRSPKTSLPSYSLFEERCFSQSTFWSSPWKFLWMYTVAACSLEVQNMGIWLSSPAHTCTPGCPSAEWAAGPAISTWEAAALQAADQPQRPAPSPTLTQHGPSGDTQVRVQSWPCCVICPVA